MLRLAYENGIRAALEKYAVAKAAANVGLGFSSARHEGPGAVRGEPADVGRRQRSVIDRTFQANDDVFATSSMPAPGASVSP